MDFETEARSIEKDVKQDKMKRLSPYQDNEKLI